jgi:two-component system cell cycle response regulator
MSSSLPAVRPFLALIANDDEWATRSLESLLAPAGYAVLRAYTGSQALHSARGAQPDVVVLGSELPDMAGLDLCRRLRDEGIIPGDVPVLMLSSGAVGRSERLQAYHAGVWELYSTPMDGESLLAKLDTFLGARREVVRLEQAALLDGMTGLYNARGLARRAREIGADAQRHHAPLACVALAPEALGADRIDPGVLDALAMRVASNLADMLRRTGRQSDAIGRLGQMEFAIVAPATHADGAMRMIERLRESLERDSVLVEGERQNVRILAGYAAVPDFSAAQVDAVGLLLQASAALRHRRTHREPGGSASAGFQDVPTLFTS